VSAAAVDPDPADAEKQRVNGGDNDHANCRSTAGNKCPSGEEDHESDPDQQLKVNATLHRPG
jgi:hypothetical protein